MKIEIKKHIVEPKNWKYPLLVYLKTSPNRIALALNRVDGTHFNGLNLENGEVDDGYLFDYWEFFNGSITLNNEEL